jgi:hypothetical protein
MQEDKEKEQRIRERAYQIWLNEGQFDDAKELHWERAKREIEEEDRKDHHSKRQMSLPPVYPGLSAHQPLSRNASNLLRSPIKAVSGNRLRSAQTSTPARKARRLKPAEAGRSTSPIA